jgi:hypothetical protein
MAEVPSIKTSEEVLHRLSHTSKSLPELIDTLDIYQQSYAVEIFEFLVSNCVRIHKENPRIKQLELSLELVDVFVYSRFHDEIVYYGLADDVAGIISTIAEEVIDSIES